MMKRFSRTLRLEEPMLRGDDVLALQRQLRRLSITAVSEPDGVFGPATHGAVQQYQRQNSLAVDGVVGPLTWNLIFSEGDEKAAARSSLDWMGALYPNLLKTPHQRFEGSVKWALSPNGLCLEDPKKPGSLLKPEDTGGDPASARRVWGEFGHHVVKWGALLGVPAELIVATMLTETGGQPDSVREEPGYVSDEATPARVSPGLMQTLISTARETLGDDSIGRDWLLIPENSIRAGTALIARQSRKTNFDPPVVGCAYNAGSVRENNNPANRWRMVQYPVGTAEHADRFVRWFNDCFRMFAAGNNAPDLSWYRVING